MHKILITLVFLSCFAYGAGDSQIIGKLNNGDEYVLQSDCMYDDPECEQIKDHYTIFIRSKSETKRKIVTSCNFNERDEFLCATDQNSPFSGAIYSIKPYKGKCEDGDPETIFICKKNCSEIPNKMTSGYWEC